MSDTFEVGNIRQAALLIDADNFSDPQAIDAAWTELKAYAGGRVSVCRAYGAGPRLEWLRSVWRYLGTRTFPNLPLEKNTTDAALIADAVALHFQQGIRLFAIASGDADFAPLAARLREWGCEVWCFSIENIVFRDAETYYDRVRCFPAPVFVPPASMPPAPLRPAMSSPWGADTGVGAGFVAPVRPAYRPPFTPPPMPQVLDADLPEEVVRVLNVVPGLRQRPQHLCHVVPVLERNGLFDKRVTRSTEFLRKYPEYFELSPSYKPTLLTFRLPTAAGAPGENAHGEGDHDGDGDDSDAGFSREAHEAYEAHEPYGIHEVRQADADADADRPEPSPEDEAALQRILAKSASWLPDTIRQLNAFTILLEENGVVLGDKPLGELFSLYPDYFELLPVPGPATKVRLLKKPDSPVHAPSEVHA